MSKNVWDILAHTYVKPSRGHIKQIKEQIKHITKGTKTISEYMHFIKTCVDELMYLGKPMDHEDLLEKILDGLGSEYQYVIDAVNGHDTQISFDELHEKLINKEITLHQQHSLSFAVLAMTNPTAPCSRLSYHGPRHQRPLFPLRLSMPTQAPTPNLLWLLRRSITIMTVMPLPPPG